MRARLLITLGALAVAWAAEHVLLPGIDAGRLESFFGQAGLAPDTSSLNVVALGLNPLMSAFLLVEVVALLVPRWRQLRASRPGGRGALRRAGLAVTVVLAVVQAWFLARWLHRFPDPFAGGVLMAETGFGSHATVMLSLVGGTFFLIVVAELIDRYGLGCGISCLLAGQGLRSLGPLVSAIGGLLEIGTISGTDLVKQGALVFALIGSAWWILTAHARNEPWRPRPLTSLRHPTSGIWPLTFAYAALALPAQLFAFGIDLGPLRHLSPDRQPYHFVYAGLALVAGVLLTRLFYRRSLLLPVFRRLVEGAPETDLAAPALLRRLMREGLTRTLIFLMVVTALGSVMATSAVHLAPDPALVVVLTAVILDVGGEWRARWRQGKLIAVWPLNQVALVQPATDALARAGIVAWPRAAFHRSLLQFFGPYIPVVLLVPEAQADEARAKLEMILPS